MLEISGKTNLLEQNAYKYSLQDVAEPNLQRDIYTQGMVPKVPFNHRRVPMNMPEEIWITDTSLRDGQQSVEPYTVDQIVNIYKYLSRLGGPYGIIRQTEFFIYSKKDREALEKLHGAGAEASRRSRRGSARQRRTFASCATWASARRASSSAAATTTSSRR